jgi:hypothetical protein
MTVERENAGVTGDTSISGIERLARVRPIWAAAEGLERVTARVRTLLPRAKAGNPCDSENGGKVDG